MADNKTPASAPAPSATSFLDDVAGDGFQGMGASDYAIPFLKILQALSPECTKGDPSYIPGAEAGVFFNSLTKRIYGAEISLVPLLYEPLWLVWAPKRGGLKGRYAPGAIPTVGSVFDEDGLKDEEGNSVVDTMNFYCLVEGHLEDGPIVFSLSSSGLKHGKNWNSQILLSRLDSGKRAPYYASVWKLSLVLNSNDDGKWYQIGTKTTNISRARFITPDEYTSFIKDNRQALVEGHRKADFSQIEGPKADRKVGDVSEF